MKNISLPQWINENKKTWEIICRIDDKRFTLSEVKKLIKEMRELTDNSTTKNNEFYAIYRLIIEQYYKDLFPDISKKQI